MEIKKLGVLGCGQMGSGIVQVFAQAGYEVVAVDTVPAMIEKGLKGIEKRLMGRVDKGKMSPDEKNAIMGRIRTSSKLEDLADCDLIEEAIPEDLELKKKTFAELDRICKPETIFGSNTSGLSVTDMAVATKRSERVMGMHFHNPAPVMQLLELVKTIMTGDMGSDPGKDGRRGTGRGRLHSHPPLHPLSPRRRQDARGRYRDEGRDRHIHEVRGQPSHGAPGSGRLHRPRHGALHCKQPLRRDEGPQVRPSAPPHKDGHGGLAGQEVRKGLLRL